MRSIKHAVLWFSLLAGCGNGGMDGPVSECQKACRADSATDHKVCGTDRATYAECAAVCGDLPKGVGFFPGECQADGSPAPGSPSKPADGDTICNYYKVGSRWVAVACFDDLDDPVTEVGTHLGDADGSDFMGTGWQLPAEVDHRSRYVSAKNQGQASSCTAFALTGALEGAIRATVGQRISLSEMHLWARYHQTLTEAAMNAAREGGIAATQDADASGLRYDDALASDWIDGKRPPDAMLIEQVDGKALFEVVGVDMLSPLAGKQVPSAEQIQHSLAMGLDLYVTMGTGEEWGNPSAGVIAPYDHGAEHDAHAALLVGYKTLNGKPHFIIRNSWGADWADGGYAYIAADTLEKNIGEVVAVAVRRLDGPDTAPACAAGEAADLAGDCRKLCADGALADPAGSCEPTSATCAAGLVADAGGQCVAACASMPRTYPGMRVECRDRACTWHVDHGVMGCNAGTGKTCDKTCPAPTCGVVTRQNELGQTVWGCAAAAQ